MRARGERGAVLAEFAIVVPVLLLLIFGGISAADLYDLKQQMSHAARQGARYASTLPIDGFAETEDKSRTDRWLDEVARRTVAAGAGTLAVDLEGRAVCVGFFDGTAWRSRSEATDGTATYANARCHDDEVTSTDPRLQVGVARSNTLDAIFLSRPVTMTDRITSKYEVPIGV